MALDADGSVTGSPLSVVEFVAGSAIRSADDLASLSDGEITVVTEALVAALVDLHAVEPAAVGLAAFGRPEGFLTRQVNR